MRNTVIAAFLGAIVGIFLAGTASADTDVPAGNITVSTTWTKANSPYHLKGQVYVTGGATLTIQAGTVIASYVADEGSLAVCRDGKIKVLGTAAEPVIMTSANDVGTWTGSVVTRDGSNNVTAITTMGNPKSGTWREACNEWGNLTMMGEALIGAQYEAGSAVGIRRYQDGVGAPIVTNTGRPTGLNKAVMEGLTAQFVGDPRQLYGGANDDHDSGELHYLSLRYGGKVIGLTNELNGLSMGSIGRATEVDHIEIMNNIDDGIEIWGGTVNLKYLAIWNIGDDSFDVDEGWRGKAQFGLIVQGYSVRASQGSGTGDNAFEIDGAEANDAVPMTCASIYNWTVIGQPDGQGPGGIGVGGDHGVAFRDNAHVQFRQCILMNLGEKLIQEEASESGTGSWRYGTNGVPTWTQVWTMPYSETWNTANVLTGGHANMKDASGTALTQAQIQALFEAQSQGNNLGAHNQGYLCEMTDSVFYSNLNGAAYTNSSGLGPNVAGGLTVTVGVASSPSLGNVVADIGTRPIAKAVGRSAAVSPSGSLWMGNVIDLDPRAAGDALTSVDAAPLDGFFTPVRYRGAFSKDVNWLLGWTASDAFSFHAGQTNTSNPTATLALQMTTTSFQTVNGVTYTVESSTDGRNWVPFAVVAGDGGLKTVSSLTGFDSTKLYRVIAQ